jgi:hypothetical protein
MLRTVEENHPLQFVIKRKMAMPTIKKPENNLHLQTTSIGICRHMFIRGISRAG